MSLRLRKLLLLLLIFVCLVGFLDLRLFAALPIVSVSRLIYCQDDNQTLVVQGTNYVTIHNSVSGSYLGFTYVAVGGQRYSNGTYQIFRMYLVFDTSIIPDNANITEAILSLRLQANYSTTDFNLTIQNGQPTYPHFPLNKNTDFNQAVYSGNGGARNTSEITELGWWNITLNSDGMDWIQEDTYTKICLRSSKDIDSEAPVGNEFIYVCGYSAGINYKPKLYVTYDCFGTTYILHGAFNEEGSFAGAINLTVFRETENPYTITLDGEANVTSESQATLISFNFGYNESRTYYVYEPYEEIFVFKPQEPYYTYFFQVLDYVGLQWGYLESVLNVNGTERVVERWSLSVQNNMPFTFAWGKAYTMRLVCDRGSYTYGSYVAGATTSFTLAVTSDMFPITPTDINGLSVSAERKNVTWIRCYYDDIYNSTSWVSFDIYEYGSSTSIFHYNTSLQQDTVNWQEAASDTDYYVVIEISHTLLGSKSWSFPCPCPITTSNPFDALNLLGTFPFAANQLPAVIILVAVGLCFSWYSIPIGMIVEVIVAALLVWLGWLAIGWGWMTISGCMVTLMALAEAKQREIGT